MRNSEEADTTPNALETRIAQIDAEIDRIARGLLPKQLKTWEREEMRRMELEQRLWELSEELANRDSELRALEAAMGRVLESDNLIVRLAAATCAADLWVLHNEARRLCERGG